MTPGGGGGGGGIGSALHKPVNLQSIEWKVQSNVGSIHQLRKVMKMMRYIT